MGETASPQLPAKIDVARQPNLLTRIVTGFWQLLFGEVRSEPKPVVQPRPEPEIPDDELRLYQRIVVHQLAKKPGTDSQRLMERLKASRPARHLMEDTNLANGIAEDLRHGRYNALFDTVLELIDDDLDSGTTTTSGFAKTELMDWDRFGKKDKG